MLGFEPVDSEVLSSLPPSTQEAKKEFNAPEKTVTEKLDQSAVWDEVAAKQWRDMCMVMEVSDNSNPGIAIEYARDELIHEALGCSGSPLSPACSAVQSATKFKTYIQDLIFNLVPCTLCGVNLVPPSLAPVVYSNAHFHRFSNQHHAVVMGKLSEVKYMSWQLTLRAKGLSLGRIFFVAHEEGENVVDRAGCVLFPMA